jgi:hypothetical protein
MRGLCRVNPFPGIKLRISRRNGPGRNPQNGVEGIHRVEATVETKYEFIEIGLQMTRLDPAVVSAINPCLQIGEDKMDHRQVFLRLLRISTEDKRAVLVTHFAKSIISLPAVSANNGASCYVVLDKCGERFSITTGKRNICPFGARDDAEPEAPRISEFLGRNAARTTLPGILACPNFDRANNRRLVMSSPSFTTRAPTNAAFVYFDGMRRPDGIAVWPNHTGAELMKHRERRLICSNIELALKLDGGLAWRLCRHEVRAPKPRRKRHMARLHNRPGGERRILFASPAAQYNRRAGCETVRLADVPASWASEAVRPANCLQITRASAIIRENVLKFRKARWEGCIHV